MQWVETTGRTLEEAKELALDQLGVTEDDADFEVLEEPRPGLFGRVRGEARVRARVRPTTPRAKVERRDKRKPRAAGSADGDEGSGTDAAEPAPASAPAPAPAKRRSGSAGARAPRPATVAAAIAETPTAVAGPGDDDNDVEPESRPASGNKGSGARGGRGSRSRPESREIVAGAPASEAGGTEVSAEEVGNEAVRFLDGLVQAFELEGSSELDRDGDEMEVRVTGPELGLLIGPRGQTLLAIQEITRVVSQRRLGDHETRLRIDIGGYRERRREALSRFTIQQADAVKESGLPRRLEPMPSADRKVVHDTVATIEGVVSKSEGDDPFRRVVIVPVGSADQAS